ncbi:MAG TPA: serine/threonine-protein kinase, partial [Polyangiales bacterium]|nr:serine/threonine-protein kinase [Polyangiales bacterium]
MRLQDLAPAEARRVAALLDEVLDVPVAERSTWQSELAQREPQWSGLVAELLSALEVQDQPHTGVQVAAGLARAAASDAATEGRRFGPYQVQRLLGQGGMGSVWLAARADGLFQRQVALKLPHPSPAFGALRERFARERSILAALAHPLIAQLLDAGVTQDGQPYLALEYVAGRSLTEHCDEQRLGLRARIELMLQVLSAVQHAHQNLVVHRDLKPSNILVTPEGQVRLLDFGIAKLLTDGHAHETELTQLGGRALTPDYASPEQIAGRPITTASDVYSLGVVLYALLCGQRPYRVRRDSRGGLEDAILHTPPVRPSQQALGDQAAAARATTPRRLARALAGDLDTIVGKALKKDPAERYATADALREDLLRYLAGEPVQARPDSLAYRGWKFVGRHRLAVFGTALIVLLLVAAAGVSLWQARRAREQATIARAVQGFLLEVFRGNTDQQPDPIRARQTTARELLDIGSQRVGKSLEATPEAQAEISETLADMYHQLGLGADAARMRLQRVAALKRVHGQDSEPVAEALLLLADDQGQAGENARARATVDEAMHMLDRLGDHGSETRGLLWLAAAELDQYTSVEDMRRNAELAREHFTQHAPQRFWSNLFFGIEDSARAYYLAGELERAEAGYADALRELERRGQANSAWSVTPLVWLAESEWQGDRLEAAERHLREALALSLRFNGPLSGSTLQTQSKLGGLLHATARREEGMRLLDDVAAKLIEKGTNATPAAVGTSRRFRGVALLHEGRIAEAERSLAAEVEDLRASYPDSIPLSRALLLHAGPLLLLGRYEESAAAGDEALRLWQRCGGRSVQPHTYDPYHLQRVRLALARGDAAGARAALQAIAGHGRPTRVE